MARTTLSNAVTVRQNRPDRSLVTDHTPRHGAAARARRTPTIIAASGSALSALLALALFARSRANEQSTFARSAAATADAREQSLRTPLEALHAVDSFTRAVARNDRHQFAELARPLLARHPSLAALAWAEFVRGEDRPAYEAIGAENSVAKVESLRCESNDRTRFYIEPRSAAPTRASARQRVKRQWAQCESPHPRCRAPQVRRTRWAQC